MNLLLLFLGYIILTYLISIYLKNRKKKEKLFDRSNFNDYMNDPKFSNMSCNKHNPNSSFFDSASIKDHYLNKTKNKENKRTPNYESEDFDEAFAIDGIYTNGYSQIV